MTERIAIVGNSHVGALKLANDREDTHLGEVSFFAVPGTIFRLCSLNTSVDFSLDLRRANRKQIELCKRLNAGQTSISLDGFSTVLLTLSLIHI